MINKLISKLQMLGMEILGYNSFAVVYKQGNELKAIRYVFSHSKVRGVEERDFDTYDINRYFLKLNKLSWTCVLYTKYSERNLYERDMFLTIVSYNESEEISEVGLYRDSKIILCEGIDGSLSIVNYKGKRIDITRFKEKQNKLDYGIIYDKRSDTYKIGYGERHYKSIYNPYKFGVTTFCYLIASVDVELENIKYMMDK